MERKIELPLQWKYDKSFDYKLVRNSLFFIFKAFSVEILGDLFFFFLRINSPRS